ncbi:MAG: hypothetical protein LBV26_01655 [Bacteroidales bacterium]|jgi:hypothetical protein|nr:hypothetical protein [Bacteroidales bacterium]
MGLISTQLISCSEIEVNNTDLFEDAIGMVAEFSDVIALLGTTTFEPGKDLMKKLSDRIKETSG